MTKSTASTSFTTGQTPAPSPDNASDCPSLEGNVTMDLLTQEQFTRRLMHSCRYDKVVIPTKSGGPLDVTLQIDVKHIEAVEQLVGFYSR